MLIVTPPKVSGWPPRYWCTRLCGIHPSLRTYDEKTSALPFQSAIQSWSGSTNLPGVLTRASSSILIPDAALE